MRKSICRETLEWATLSIWLMDQTPSRWDKIRCIIGFIGFTALFIVMWAKGNAAFYTQPGFIVLTVAFIIYSQASLLFRMRREGWL
ncbi:hypothetical protein BH012_09880 [Salmonella enterica]|nr:hypothetical protein [Salmonella enterica]EAX6601630.1 hypothetical protein [Salmonella enterica]